VATSAGNPEKISANEGSMEALIKRRRQLLEELAAWGDRLFACSSKPAFGEDHASATTWPGRGPKERLVAVLEIGEGTGRSFVV